MNIGERMRWKVNTRIPDGPCILVYLVYTSIQMNDTLAMQIRRVWTGYDVLYGFLLFKTALNAPFLFSIFIIFFIRDNANTIYVSVFMQQIYLKNIMKT